MTSSILLATDASNPQVVGSYNLASTAEEKGKLLPKPSGYRILCAIPEAEKEFEDLRKKTNETQTLAHKMILEIAEKLTPEQRKKFLNRNKKPL